MNSAYTIKSNSGLRGDEKLIRLFKKGERKLRCHQLRAILRRRGGPGLFNRGTS